MIVRKSPSGPIVINGDPDEPAALGSILIGNGQDFQQVEYPTVEISSNVAQTPTIAQGLVFFTDDSLLTANRTITPTDPGDGLPWAMTFYSLDASGAFHYSVEGFDMEGNALSIALSTTPLRVVVGCFKPDGTFQIGNLFTWSGF